MRHPCALLVLPPQPSVSLLRLLLPDLHEAPIIVESLQRVRCSSASLGLVPEPPSVLLGACKRMDPPEEPPVIVLLPLPQLHQLLPPPLCLSSLLHPILLHLLPPRVQHSRAPLPACLPQLCQQPHLLQCRAHKEQRLCHHSRLDGLVDGGGSVEGGHLVHFDHPRLSFLVEQDVEPQQVEAGETDAVVVPRDAGPVRVRDLRLHCQQRLDDASLDILPDLLHVVPVGSQP
mmetsp:Transcript_35774/g.111907  ORF Transcript_35774/g.111907 Transcript_35774/m.111907 type:complete len:231 (+) Transcript_35774:330-1022(+)